MLGPGEGAGVLMPLEIIVHSRIRRQQAEDLGICSNEGGEEGGGPPPAMAPRTGVGETAPEVGGRTEREEEERRRREAMAEAWRKLQACLPRELRDSR